MEYSSVSIKQNTYMHNFIAYIGK